MRLRHVLALTAVSFASAALVTPQASEAAPSAKVLGKPKAPAKPQKAVGPTEIDKKIKLTPDGLKFGMNLKNLSNLYAKVFEAEFVPLYQRVQPGPRMAELDAELADKKQHVRRNLLEFGNLPMGLDRTALAGEYTYNNGESLTHVTLRDGVKRYFFFFGDRLWKVYDEHRIGKNGRLGKDFDEVVGKLATKLGKPPRKLKADPEAKRNFDQADWADKETIVRVLDRGDSVALVYVDRKVEENIDRHRTNTGEAAEVLDRNVADVTKGGDAEDKNKDVGAAYKSKKK